MLLLACRIAAPRTKKAADFAADLSGDTQRQKRCRERIRTGKIDSRSAAPPLLSTAANVTTTENGIRQFIKGTELRRAW
jgi:hypothetical protein